MKIWPLVLTCERDLDLYGLMETSLRKKEYRFERTILSIDEGAKIDPRVKRIMDQHGALLTRRKPGYGNWDNWDSCLVFFSVLSGLAKDQKIGPEDYIMDADSDIVFLGTSFTNELDGSDLIGVHVLGERMDYQKFGVKDWTHFSGAFLLIKGSFLQKIAIAERHGFPGLKEEIRFTKKNLCDDVSISVLALMSGSKLKALNRDKTFQSYSEAVAAGKYPVTSDLIHWELNSAWKSFLGIPIAGRWEIPKALRASGINWP